MAFGHFKLWIGGVAVLLIGAAGMVIVPYLYHPSVSIVGFPPLAYPGFQTWPTPRDFDGPGTLFVLDRDYLEYRATLPVSVTLVGDEALPTIQSSGKWSGSVLAQFLGATNSLNVASSQNIDVALVADGVQRWRANPGALQSALQAYSSDKHTASLFVITEAISVTKLHL